MWSLIINNVFFYCFLSGIIKTKAVLDIETKSHYWLTVFAQDHGVVPLFSSVEVSENFYFCSQQQTQPAFQRSDAIKSTRTSITNFLIEFIIKCDQLITYVFKRFQHKALVPSFGFIKLQRTFAEF